MQRKGREREDGTVIIGIMLYSKYFTEMSIDMRNSGMYRPKSYARGVLGHG
jgi:hypothetical protein